MNTEEIFDAEDSCDIAIIGMDGRFPRARNTAEFWQLLRDGREGISFFTDDELEVEVSAEDLRNANFVKAKGVLDDAELFDAQFFNIPAREAEWMDPQQRLFLECAWNALENAGYNVETYRDAVAVYAGVGVNTYIMSRLAQVDNASDFFQVVIANDKDHIATRVSYKLNLRGESMTVQSSCSSSLVAVHLACQSLLSGQSEMALAGGATIQIPQKSGYLYEEGMIASPDGHCRAFDHRAQGTIGGNGVGVVVLKRLVEAFEDGDNILAVIKGSAINNDGNLKVGYTAPSIDGQANVIAKALAIAGVKADTISYIEAHGTGTPLGDPVEVEALMRVFSQHTDRHGFCALGSVKTNIGHLDTAAGVAGLIKAVLALQHREIPPTLHFEKPNPTIDFANSPFYVNNRLIEWKNGTTPRRAGVSSFGMGGTNVHMVLEEAPARRPVGASRRSQLFTLSAKTPAALRARTRQLAESLESTPDINLADAAYTLNVGRQTMAQKRFIVARDAEDLARALRAEDVSAPTPQTKKPRIAFMFPGQGTQYAGMAKELYANEPTFREHVDRCARLLKEQSNLEILPLLYPSPENPEAANARLAQPESTLPALFTVEYALAQLWMSWGMTPDAMIGYSYGEYVAACLAGVFSLEDGLRLSVTRGRLMQGLEPGAMTAVRLSETDVQRFLNDSVSVATVGSNRSCVLTGPVGEIEKVERELEESGAGCRRLAVPFAYHSLLIDPILDEFSRAVAAISLHAPRVPYISNLTGKWIEATEATSPQYWAQQMRRTVRFADGLDALLARDCKILLEVGPEQSLCAAARQHLGGVQNLHILPSLGRAQAQKTPDDAVMLNALGEIWQAGQEVDWAGFYAHERRRRVSLPTYPFEGRRYWIEVIKRERVAREQGGVQLESNPAPSVETAFDESTTAVVEATASTAAAKHPVERLRLPESYQSPQSATEERLVQIWSDVLGLEGIGTLDSFFDLGGDSLLATQLYSRIKQSLAADITLREVLSSQTIQEFARVVEDKFEHNAESEPHQHAVIRRADREGQLPLSYSQQRLWIIDQSSPAKALYNLMTAVRLTGRLNTHALERSLNEIIRRHEALRTNFVMVGGQPRQIIAPVTNIVLLVTDLASSAEAEREEQVKSLVAEEAQKPFDLTQNVMLRVSLLRLNEEEHVMLLTMHHIASDAWSFGVLVREIATLYKAFAANEPSPLPELSIQYADYAQWQREWLSGEVLENQLAYWRKQLGGTVPALELPTDRPRPVARGFRGGTHNFNIRPEVTAKLKQLTRDEAATMYMTLLAAFQILLGRYARRDDFATGTPIAGRNREETEQLIGFFVNTLVMRADLSGNPSFRELLGRVREVALGAYTHQDVPFETLVEELQPERDPLRTPFFQVLFNYQNTPLPEVEISGLRLAPIEVESGAARFDLSLNIVESGEGLAGTMEYDVDLFDAETVVRLMSHFETLLEDIAERPGASIHTLEILTEAERQAQQQKERERKGSMREKLKTTRRKSINSTNTNLVRTGLLGDDGETLPLLVEPEVAGVDLCEWARNNRETVEGKLFAHGAMLFRGFGIDSAPDFKKLAAAVSSELLDYKYRSTPRTEISEKIYTSTEYPADQSIPLHNENAYSDSWPMKLLFFCAQAAQQGGETPIADSRKIFRLLDARLRDEFIDKKVMYVRNYGEGLDLPWEEVFQTTDKQAVERFCRESNIDFEWRSQNRLRTRQVCQSVATHPRSGEVVWFNQAHLFHVASLAPGLRESMLATLDESELPRNVYFGDGTPIEPRVIDEIQRVYNEAAVSFRWQDGDVLLVDNMLVAHGRKPYSGPRKVLVAMADNFRSNGEFHLQD